MKAFYKTYVLGAWKRRLIVDGRRLKTDEKMRKNGLMENGLKNIRIRVDVAFK